MATLITAFIYLLSILYSAPRTAAYAPDVPLNGLELRCCTIVEPPIVQRDNSTVEHYNGVAIAYLRQLELRLGFRCRTLGEYADATGAPLTFTGAVDRMHACTAASARPDNTSCECDLGVGGWSMNEERVDRVDFVQPFAYDFYRVATHANNTMHPVGNVFFFSAFDASVWLATLLLACVFAMLKLLGPQLRSASEAVQAPCEPPDERLSYVRRLSHSLEKIGFLARTWHAFRSVCEYITGTSEQDEDAGKPGWQDGLLNMAIFVSVLFLVLAYKATMTNALVNEEKISKLKGLSHFQNCIIPADEVCITQDSGAHGFWQNAVASRDCHYQRDAPRVLTKKTFDGTLQAFLNYECKYMIGLGSEMQEIVQGRHCGKVRLTGTPFRDTGVSFILPQNSNLTNMFSNATLELRDKDMIPTPQDFLSQKGRCNHKDPVHISFRKIVLFVLFLLFSSAIVLGLILCATWRAIPKEREDLFW